MATLKENFFKNRGLAVNPLTEMQDGMPSRAEIRAAERKFKSHLSSNPQVAKQLADLQAQKQSLQQQEDAISQQIMNIDDQIRNIQSSGGYFA
jgi:predicted  nucleic acid-binding Zn-ribbon protein